MKAGLDPLGDHADLLGVHAVEAEGVALRVVGDRDHPIGTLEEPRDHHPEKDAVPRKVVLGEVQVGRVVQREDAARPRELGQQVVRGVEQRDPGEGPIHARCTEVGGGRAQPPPAERQAGAHGRQGVQRRSQPGGAGVVHERAQRHAEAQQRLGERRLVAAHPGSLLGGRREVDAEPRRPHASDRTDPSALSGGRRSSPGRSWSGGGARAGAARPIPGPAGEGCWVRGGDLRPTCRTRPRCRP